MAEPIPEPTHERELKIGLVRLKENMLNHAELIFQRVLEAAPGHPLATRLLGIAVFRLGRRAEGLALIRQGAEAAGADARAWADLAVALRDDGQGEAAGEAYARALAASAGAPPPLERQAFSSDLGRHAFKLVDYDYAAEIRFGAGRPAHPELTRVIGAGRSRYGETLERMGEIQADFAEIPLGGSYESDEPFWLNAWFMPLDGLALTERLRTCNPRRFVEVGSGISTKFARRAVSRYGLRTRLTSIDPEPRNQIDRLCDQVIRRPLEQCRMEMFEDLNGDDILFIDSSHRAFQGSDVTVFFLEILPRLRPGVTVHLHDIYLPFDYISGHVWRLWNEQYLLATALLFGSDRFEILFPSWFVTQDPALSAQAGALIRRGALEGLGLHGASFWMRIR